MADVPDTQVLDAESYLDEDTWEEAATPRALRLRWLTAGLVTLGLLAGGFWIGAVVQRHDGATTTAAASTRSAFARAFGAGAGAGAGTAAGAAGGAGAATRGTVIAVTGSTVDVSTAAGSIVKVTIGPATTVGRTAVGAPGALSVGDTVTVEGTTGADGTVAAASITATAQGVTAPAAGGLGGGGFGGGGA